MNLREFVLDIRQESLHLLLGSSLLCWLLGSGFLGSRLLGFLCCGLLCSLLGSRFLGGLLHLWFLGSSGLLGLGFLGSRLLGLLSQPVGACSLARGSGHLQAAGSNSFLEGQTQVDGSLGSIDLVVGAHV